MVKLTETYRKLVRGTTINETTLLSTDYLNHFNELVMMVEMAADMPELLGEVLEWRFKDYQAHFADSVFQHKELAVWAYESTPDSWKRPFDACTDALKRTIEAELPRLAAAHEAGETRAFRATCLTLAGDIRQRLDAMSAIINGAVDPDEAAALAARAESDTARHDAGDSAGVLGQSDIDKLFE